MDSEEKAIPGRFANQQASPCLTVIALSTTTAGVTSGKSGDTLWKIRGNPVEISG